MAAVVKQWIAPAVEKQLRKHLEAQESSHLALDNKVLRLSIKQGGFVQLIHVDDDGLHQVSDKETSIIAEFESSGIEAFQQNGREFSDIEGSVITILTYDIILDWGAHVPVIPKFLVKTFKLRGSEGSPTFGKPLDIQENPGIQRVVEELVDMYSRNNADATSELSWSPSPIRSQEGDGKNRTSPGKRKRSTEFATQVYDVPKRAARQTEARVPDQKVLLGILKSQPGTLSKLSAGKTTAQEPGSIASGSTSSSVLQPISEDRARIMASTLEAKSNSRPSQSTTHSSFPDPAQYKIEKPRATERESPSGNSSEKENSQEMSNGLTRQPVKPTNPEVISISQRAIMQLPMPFDDIFESSNPFQGLKRVPRKFVRISTAQKVLLESNDSWFEPNLDGRPRYARLPPKVMEDLDKFYKHRPDLVVEDGSDEYESDDMSEDQEDAESPRRKPPASDKSPKATFDCMESDEELSEEESNFSSSPFRGPNDREGVIEPIGPDVERSTVKIDTFEQPELTQDVPQVSIADDEEVELPSAQQMRRSASVSRNIARPLFRMPVLRSSSPFLEEELDLAVPHAVGDIIEEDDEQDDGSDTSQELPCTAPSKGKQIQVEQTPIAGYHGTHDLLKSSTSKVALLTNNITSSTIPSSAVFPATVDNPNIDAFTSSSVVQNNTTEEDIPEESRQSSDNADIPLQSSSELVNLFQYVAPQPPPSTPMISSSGPQTVLKSPIVQVPATSQKFKQTHPDLRFPPPARKRISGSASPENISPKRPRSDVGPMNPRQMKKANRQKFLQSEKIRANDAPADVVILKSTAALAFQKTNAHIEPPLDAAVRVSSTYAEDQLANASSRQKDVPALIELATIDLGVAQEASTLHPTPQKVGLDTFIEEDMPVDEQFINQGENIASQDILDLRSPSPENDTPQLDLSQEVSNKSRRVTPTLQFTFEGESISCQEFLHLRSPTPVEDAVRPQLSQQSSNKSLGTSPPLEHKFYDEFIATYSDYDGSEFDFIKALVYLEWLQKEHATKLAYCDDFIRVMNTEYRKHVRESCSLGARPLTGIDFYTQKTRNTAYRALYRYNVISALNIPEALLTLDAGKVEEIRGKYWGQKNSTRQIPSSSPTVPRFEVSDEPNEVMMDDHNKSSPKADSFHQESEKRISSPPQAYPAKKRFFETASQPVNPGLEKVQTPKKMSKSFDESANVKTTRLCGSREGSTPRRALSNPGSGASSKKHRSLPWPTDKAASEGSSTRPQERRSLPRRTDEAKVFTSSPLGTTRRQITAENIPLVSTPASRGLNDLSKESGATLSSENPPSPILESLRSPESQRPNLKRPFDDSSLPDMDDPFTTSEADRRSTLPARSANEIPRDSKRKRSSDPTPTDPEDPFTGPSKASKAARRATMPAQGTNSLVKAEEWLRSTPLKKMSPFEAKVDRMRLSGWVPKSQRIQRITGKSYCTTMKKPESEMSEEPKTQAWNF